MPCLSFVTKPSKGGLGAKNPFPPLMNGEDGNKYRFLLSKLQITRAKFGADVSNYIKF